jgi:hypothetical protein
VILQDRRETLKEILNTPWDFECPLHGAQREIPIEAKEKEVTLSPRPVWSLPTEPSGVKPSQRSSKRLSLQVPVLAYGWAGGESAFHEESSTLLVNASGGLIALTTKVKLGDAVFLVNKGTQEEQECRVAYVGPEVGGRTRVGVAFKHPAHGFWRTRRQEYRIAKPLRVWVRGVDRSGHPFAQTAYAIDISRNGARLDGVGYLTWPGETIEVKRRWRKARFRVVWVGQVGTPQANQVGICSLEPNKYIWGVPLPQPTEAKPEQLR